MGFAQILRLIPLPFLRTATEQAPPPDPFDAWHRRAIEDGYSHWMYNHPPPGAWIEASRQGWGGHTQIWKSGQEPEWLNVYGLWWRPLDPPEERKMSKEEK